MCTVSLYAQARKAGVIITPGRLFTAQQRYQHFLRISFAHPWTKARTKALQQLGKFIASEAEQKC